jgi:DNA-binding transcriptional LysR family regulator
VIAGVSPGIDTGTTDQALCQRGVNANVEPRGRAMELRHLRYFVAIAEERSFTRAAERLWVAQPGLSSQIRRLEAELGVRLFERHTRGVDLTDAGELFLERARATLAAAEDARSTGRDLEAGLVGTVRLGLAMETPAAFAASLLAAFARDRPDVEVTAIESYGGTLSRDLRDGRLDALIAPSLFASAELRCLRLGAEPWVVLVARGHRLWTPGPLNARELRGETIVVSGHRDAAGYDRAVVDLALGLGVTPARRRGGAGPALRAAVAAGEALALTTAAAATGRDMLVRPLDPVRRLPFALLCRDETPAPALRELIRAAEASLARDVRTLSPIRAAAA